jgi:Putative DNA-binding domain
VAIWRSPELETLFGCTLDADGLTASALQRLIEQGAAEGDQLEFKRDRYDTPKSKRGRLTPEQECAKDCAALGNHRGGIILLGMEERSRVAHRVVSFNRPTAEQVERQLLQWLSNHVAPWLQVEIVTIAVDGGYVLALVVPPSPRAPHAVVTRDSVDSTRPLRYPVRNGSNTRWLLESEVAERQVRRAYAAEQDAAQLAAVVDQGQQELRLGAGVWLYVAMLPEVRTIQRLDREAVGENERWVRAQNITSPLEDGIFDDLRAFAAPRRTNFWRPGIHDDPEMKPSGVHLELHTDGSVFAATAVVARSTPQGDTRTGESDIVGLRTITRDIIPLIELASRWAVHQATVPGAARLQAGLFDADSPDGGIHRPIELQAVDAFGQRVRLPRTRRFRGAKPTIEALVDLSSGATTARAVENASILLDGLLQWFGLADSPQVMSDGSIRANAWGPDWAASVRRWAEQHGVPVS